MSELDNIFHSISLQQYVRMEYIPVVGKKEYCDKIRELSGAMDKDKKVHLIYLIASSRYFINSCGFIGIPIFS